MLWYHMPILDPFVEPACGRAFLPMHESNSNRKKSGQARPDVLDRSESGRARQRRIRGFVFSIKLGLDGFAFGLAWLTAWAIREYWPPVFGRELNPHEIYWKSLPIIVLGSLLTSAAVGSYAARRTQSPIAGALMVAKSAINSLLVVMSLGFLVKEFDYSRAVVVMFGIFSLLFLPLARRVASLVEERLVKLGIVGTRVLIVGAGQTGLRALQKVQDHPEIGYRIVGFLDDDPAKIGTSIGRTKVLAGVGQLRNIVVDERIDEVIIAMPQVESQDLMALVMKIDDLQVRVRVVADLFGVLNRDTQIDVIEDIPIYDLKGPDVSHWYRLTKRAFDLAIGVVAVVVFILLLPFIALAIKLDSPGPVFFVHERVGKHGIRFKMWKFRTMRVEADAYAVAPNQIRDPRVTKVGAFLRKTSLDELPQVINVLCGNMSIVGPRPEMPFIVEQYNDWQRKRLDVVPGITGLWQILGRKDLPLHDNLEYDFYYIKNRSLLLDFVILVKTFTTVLTGKGAY